MSSHAWEHISRPRGQPDWLRYHRLERERIHLLLIDDARRGLEDITAGRTHEADAALAAIQKRRTAAAPAAKPVKKRG